MNEVIILRPHHLCEIYDIFAAALSCDMFMPNKEHINGFIADRIYFLNSNTDYPKETIKKLRDVLLKFFFDDAVVVVFKKGPDDICNSGCLLSEHKSIMDVDCDVAVKRSQRTTIAELCENESAREDVIVTEIFGIEIRKYEKEELWSMMTRVFQKKGIIQWL